MKVFIVLSLMVFANVNAGKKHWLLTATKNNKHILLDLPIQEKNDTYEQGSLFKSDTKNATPPHYYWLNVQINDKGVIAANTINDEDTPKQTFIFDPLMNHFIIWDGIACLLETRNLCEDDGCRLS